MSGVVCRSCGHPMYVNWQGDCDCVFECHKVEAKIRGLQEEISAKIPKVLEGLNKALEIENCHWQCGYLHGPKNYELHAWHGTSKLRGVLVAFRAWYWRFMVIAALVAALIGLFYIAATS